MVDILESERGQSAGCIVNPGGLTHTSVVLADALRGFGGPVIEVHLSNILAREPFRRVSLSAEAAVAVISGLGVDGYVLAVEGLAKLLEDRSTTGSTFMITASDLRPGATVERDGDLFEVIDFSHMKQGRGTAVVRAKLRNVTTGAVTDETFRPEEKFGKVRIERTRGSAPLQGR